MRSGLFETFCELIDGLPTKAVIKAAEAERRMVEEDMNLKRTPVDEDAISVLGFCNYLISARRGLHFPLPVWPIEHCAYYRKVVRRLVDAGELPGETRREFDTSFFQALKKALASPDWEGA